jgi:hypothetical protein
MIAAALEAEGEQYVYALVEDVDEGGKQLVGRKRRAPVREVTVVSGTLVIRAPRVNDTRVNEDTGQRTRFRSRILPTCVRRPPISPISERHRGSRIWHSSWMHTLGWLSAGRWRATTGRAWSPTLWRWPSACADHLSG